MAEYWGQVTKENANGGIKFEKYNWEILKIYFQNFPIQEFQNAEST